MIAEALIRKTQQQNKACKKIRTQQNQWLAGMGTQCEAGWK